MNAPGKSRHKTAISRGDLSRPIKLALADGLVRPEIPLFDYGCGRGDDLRQLQAMGYHASGWDPTHRPKDPIRPSPVVNLGYVINVIENPTERKKTLERAWKISEKVLVVSSRLKNEAAKVAQSEDYADGCVTSRGTFQKFYEQKELKEWIEKTLDHVALPAAPGVFYVFRHEEDRSTFSASRYRRRIAAPRQARSVVLFNDHQILLQPLMDFFAARGRLPSEEELENAQDVKDVFGSIKKAFLIVERATKKDQWKSISKDHAQDFLIYLALSRFDRRPKISQLPRDMQLDVKSFFSNYSKACRQADSMLFSLGIQDTVNGACLASKIGKITPDAFYVHQSALESLSPLLRLFEGCARRYLGHVEGANLIKIYRHKPKLSYLTYPGFENDPHPALTSSLSVNLQTFKIRLRDYSEQLNPPILHRKELFIHESHPLHSKFSRLTKSEESKGLYQETERIGFRLGWEKLLAEQGLKLKGHRIGKF